MTFRDQKSLKKLRSCAFLRVVHQFSISSFKPPRAYATDNVFFLTCLFWKVPGSETGNFSLEFLCKELKELTRHQLGAVIQCHGVGLAVYWRLYISMLTKLEHSCTHGFLMWNSSWVTMWRQDNAFTCFHRSLSCSSVNQSPLCFSIHSFGNITMDTPIELQWITSLSIHCLQQSEFHFINLMSGFFRFLKSHLSNHSNRLPVEVHQCREVLALWCLCTAGQGHAVAGGAARGRDQRWEAYGITGVDVFWWETRAFWRHLTRWKWRLRDINLCITQYILGKNVTLVDKRLDLNNMKVLGNHHRHFLWYFHVLFHLVWLLPSQQGDSTRGRRWTWTGSWRSAAGRRWLLVDIGTSDILGCSWMLYPSGFHHMFFQTKGIRDPSQSYTLLSNVAGGRASDDRTILILLRLSWG